MYLILLGDMDGDGVAGIFGRRDIDKMVCSYDCAIGIDVSRRSTGVALYQNGIMLVYKIVTDTKYSKEDTLWEAKMKKEFRTDLESIVRGKEFDLIVVENTINGCNAITNKELVLLNSIIDELVVDKVCSVKEGRFVRPFPNVWRKELKKLGTDGDKDVKVMVEKILDALGYAFCSEFGDQSKSAKGKMGYYDICDATGMLIAYMNKFRSTLPDG